MRTPANKSEQLIQAHAFLGTGVPMPRAHNVPVAALRSIILDAETAELSEPEKLKMMAAYAMVAGATFLLPRGATAKVPDEMLSISIAPAEFHKYNIAGMVQEGLRESAVKVRQTLPLNPSQITIDGCHIALQVTILHLFLHCILCVPREKEVSFLNENSLCSTVQILFLDRMEHGKEGEMNLPVPRIAHYGDQMLKELVRKHGPRTLNCGLVVRADYNSVRVFCR
jgi:hypothetical protein